MVRIRTVLINFKGPLGDGPQTRHRRIPASLRADPKPPLPPPKTRVQLQPTAQMEMVQCWHPFPSPQTFKKKKKKKAERIKS